MKNFSKVMLSIIITVLIVGSVQPVLAYDMTDIFKPVPIRNSEYKFHLQVVLRDVDNRLISVTEATNGYYIQHDVTDKVFDYDFGKKEIVTVDNKKYEKVRWTTSGGFTPDEMNKKTKDYSIWKIGYCLDLSDIGHGKHQCLSIFQVLLPTITLELGDTITQEWTILRELGG